MSRCPRDSDPDIIHVSYKTTSNRSTRLLLLEQGAEAILAEHGECNCLACEKFKAALQLRAARGRTDAAL
jgi:hypothetical protein